MGAKESRWTSPLSKGFRHMDELRRRDLIERYMDGVRVLEAAVEGASEAELDSRPAKGEWTAREVVHHCADSEMTSAIRLRRLVAEDDPAITGYDPDGFADRLFYSVRPVRASLDAIRGARSTSAEILLRLEERDWSRSGTHSELGPYSVETWLEIYAEHCHDHADQIRHARASASRE